MTSLTTTETSVQYKISLAELTLNELKELSLEDLIENSRKYGKINLSYFVQGWHCSLEMYINVTGTEVKIRSEFNHSNSKEAVLTLLFRLKETIQSISATK